MQQVAGATFIDTDVDVHIGHENEDMCWLLNAIQQVFTPPISP